jgi:drug/metabolite transporter (DMT)-like permease
MAKTPLPIVRVIGLALIVVGAGLVYWAYQLSGSFAAQMTETFSGSMPEEVMYRYIAGAVCIAVGAFLFLRT